MQQGKLDEGLQQQQQQQQQQQEEGAVEGTGVGMRARDVRAGYELLERQQVCARAHVCTCVVHACYAG